MEKGKSPGFSQEGPLSQVQEDKMSANDKMSSTLHRLQALWGPPRDTIPFNPHINPAEFTDGETGSQKYVQ